MRLMYWIHRKTDLARTGLIVLVTALLSLGAHTPSEAQKLNSALPTDGQVIRFAISADSQRVAYQADQDTEAVTELYSVPIGGGTVTKLNSALVSHVSCSQA